MQIFFTILAGVGTFVLGQIALKLLIDPIQSLKATVAEIAHKLILYANIYGNPEPLGGEKQAVALNDFRVLSSNLQSNMHLIPAYRVTSRIFGLPSQLNIIQASKNLIFLHNGHDGVLSNQGILNCYAAQRICMALGIYIPDGERLDPDKEQSFIKAKNN